MTDNRNGKTQRHWLAALSRTAGKRVGRTPLQRLAWMLDFAQREAELVGANDKAIEQMTAEVAYFAIAGGADASVRPDINAADLQALMIFVRTGITACLDGKPWDLHLLPLKSGPEQPLSFVRTLRPDGPPSRIGAGPDRCGRLEMYYRSSSLLTIARCKAQDLVLENYRLVGRCRRCTKPFVIRRRQEYCSALCSQIERNTRWRQQHPDKARTLRHQAYERQVAREKGASAAKHVRSRIQEAPGL